MKNHLFLLGIIDAMEKQLVDNRDFFIEDENYGVEGSFRQLMID
jgi:hypothetical protein